RSLPKVGSYSGPSLEAVLAQQPDVVFAAADMSAPAWVERLEDLGIPVYVVYPRSLKGTARAIREIGQVSGVPEKADQMARRLEDAAKRIRTQKTPDDSLRTLVAVMVEPLVVASPRTLVGDLLEIAGGENIVPAEGGRWPTWGPESLLTSDPEVIIVSPHPGAKDPEAYFRRFPELQAVRNNRIVTIDPDWLQRPGPRLVLGMEALADALKTGERNVR
ncbi:MAG: helical backbone metal receptor, partial [Desulfuromonadales bacterium]